MAGHDRVQMLVKLLPRDGHLAEAPVARRSDRVVARDRHITLVEDELQLVLQVIARKEVLILRRRSLVRDREEADTFLRGHAAHRMARLELGQGAVEDVDVEGAPVQVGGLDIVAAAVQPEERVVAVVQDVARQADGAAQDAVAGGLFLGQPEGSGNVSGRAEHGDLRFPMSEI